MADEHKQPNAHPHTLTTLIKKPTHFLAFGLGSGLITPAPGTWGTVAGTLLILPLWSWFLAHPLIAALFLIITFIFGCWICDITGKDIGIHDFGGIVWDEFVGVWLVMFAMPPALLNKYGYLLCALFAFVLFRIFDIIKPPPIRQIDAHAPGGFGVMIDDILAGIFALIPLWIMAFFH